MDVKIFTDNIEEKAREQIDRLLAVPVFRDCKVRIMPDVHAGAGCVIGFTADLGKRVIPNVVGVDIGCGMRTIPLGNIDIDYEKLDAVIREKVPSGMNVHNDEARQYYDYGICDLYCFESLKNVDRIRRSIGTLGGGNHFIEIDEDAAGNKYLIIHTGSRNLGKQVAEYWQDIADKKCCGKEVYKQFRERSIKDLKDAGHSDKIGGWLEVFDAFASLCGDNVPKELRYLEGEDRDHYLNDMFICQRWAWFNRDNIHFVIMDAMGWNMPDGETYFETVHNYIDGFSNIVRKGAISASKGEKVLIPLNMRDGCIIGVGKGNLDWNCSAPHGAGRIMSRVAAKKELNVEDYAKSMSGIYTTCVCEDTIDEAPMAYKPAEEIINLIAPTVEVQKIIKPVYNFKAKE